MFTSKFDNLRAKFAEGNQVIAFDISIDNDKIDNIVCRRLLNEVICFFNIQEVYVSAKSYSKKLPTSLAGGSSFTGIALITIAAP